MCCVLGTHTAWGAKAADAVTWCGSALRAELHAQGVLVRTGGMSLSVTEGGDSLCWEWPWCWGAQWGPSAPSG